MLDQKSPEEVVKSAHKAADTLERASIVDKNILNIGELFTASSSGQYELPQQQAVQPFLPKHIFTLPPVALEQIQKWKSGDAAGILPEINRAYFAVENRLYLWDYIDRKDVNTYEETHPIVGVGLAKVKEDIFNAEITHVLVIATTVNISVIAVSFKDKKSLSFYRTEITTNSSGALMKTIVGTKFGRIFMLSDFGDVWELDYRRDEGWFTSKCSKKLVSPSAAFFRAQTGRCIDIAVDEDGYKLYKLVENSSIYVSYLGEDGKGYSDNVANNTKINDQARVMCPSSQYLENSQFKIVSIHPTTLEEASSYHLVAITSTGCRLYLANADDKEHPTPASNIKPSKLSLTHVRTPPPSSTTPQGVPQTNVLADHPVVIKSLYKDGCMLLVDKLTEQQQSVITASPNIGKMVTQGRSAGFAEFSNRLNVQGQVLGIAEVPKDEQMLNELASLPSKPARHFLIFTTHGLSIVTKQRPVDMLQNMLNAVGANITARSTDFGNFFDLFGTIQSCALCLNLACHTTTPLSGIELLASDAVSIPVVKGATQLLETLGQRRSPLSETEVYTSRHEGVALFLYRLISPIWNKKIVIESVQGNTVNYSTAVKRDVLVAVQQILRKLQAFMDRNASVYPQLQPQNEEERSYRQLYDLGGLISESISFLLYLLDNDASRIIKSLTPENQGRFKAYTFKDLLTTNDGRELAKALAMAIIDETMAKFGNLDIVTDILEQRCGTFCNSSDVLFYKAQKQIDAAKSEANTMPSRDALQESLKLLKRIAIHITYEQLEVIAKDYTQQGALVLAVELILTCAHARDPHNATTGYVMDGLQPSDARLEIFERKRPFYDCAFNLLKEAIRPSTSANQKATAPQKDQAFQVAFSSDDIAFHMYTYEKFINENLGRDLIQMDPPHIETFLKRQPFELERYELLVYYYRMKEEFEEAATVLQLLSRITLDIPTEKRLYYLNQASLCAKSVTAPSKQFEMLDLQKRLEIWIKQLQEENQLQFSSA
ncbi:Nup133 N terminal like-domain-containing protein [Phascolomyces articulosus]|uniref:Nup133 N terminal like-domain-containing protein n=1 Tax=Phascolomyces articulosus TaxID=60185 RepID=A0AAD5PDN4_9FUNG|nr:Nup133 N terminal like-domain-containing protein [Phascolomyces articulosus]